MLRFASQIAAISVLGFSTYFSDQKIIHATEARRNIDPNSSVDQNDEVMFLPKVEALEILSLDYRTALADFIWLYAVGYFGKHFKGDQDYRWLYHYCDIVTRLNPKADHAYRFCSMMLSWELSKPAEAVTILDRAIEANPRDWYFWHLRGFVRYFFLKDYERAVIDFQEASKLPDAHPAVLGLAAKAQQKQGGIDDAIALLTGMLGTTQDNTMRSMLLQRIEKMKAKKLAGTQLIDSPEEIKHQNLSQTIKTKDEKTGDQDGVPHD